MIVGSRPAREEDCQSGQAWVDALFGEECLLAEEPKLGQLGLNRLGLRRTDSRWPPMA
jgi:hypothetical protein